MGPIFSICHTTARPDGWRDSYHAWVNKFVGDPSTVEYVLCVDERWGFSKDLNWLTPLDDKLKVVWNTKRKCSVDGWNIAAQASTGKIIILNSDDVFPPERWDEKLINAISGDGYYQEPFAIPTPKDWVVETTSNTPADDRGLMVVQILSRARYERLGYAFYPEYESMYADNDFTEHARQDGVVIDAKHLVFEHRHPIVTGAGLDEQYKHENRATSYSFGLNILNRRRAAKFQDLRREEKSEGEKKRRIVAVCTPGREFDSDFLFEFGPLAIKLFCGGGFIHAPSKSCNIYAARSECLMAISTTGIRPDYIFWIDSDQLDYVKAFEQLMKRMEDSPEVDILAGWTYMQHDANINCGYFERERDDEGDLVVGKDGMFVMPNINFINGEKPFVVDWIGFGCVLMRASVIDRLAPDIFSPIYVYKGKNHWVSEDTGFSLRALEKGIDIYVDPLAYVKHMKLQEVQPKVAVMSMSKGGD